MCGRFAFYSPSEAALALFGVHTEQAIEARYNIAPTQYIAAIRKTEEQSRELVMLRWGFVPAWAKDPAIGNRMINARAETVAEKPSFRNAYRHRRCLILASGFYEWCKEATGKTPYYISAADGAPMAFAGIWECWPGKGPAEALQTTTIITAPANDFMTRLHHRMPVILRPEGADRWLSGDNDLVHRVADNTPELQAWPVDHKVNNASNEGPELIETTS